MQSQNGLKASSYPLSVYRVKPGMVVCVRMLSTAYGGCLTHWVGNSKTGRSHYCDPDTCPPATHRLPAIYKGYCSAEVYDQRTAKWAPICLEITESLELDFKHKFARGQVWEISRLPDKKDKRHPVVGKLLEECDPDTFPYPHDLIPCLRAMYHVDAIDLTTKNPMPERVMVTVSDGPPPASVRRTSPLSAKDKEETDLILKQTLEMLGKRSSTIPSTNGKAAS